MVFDEALPALQHIREALGRSGQPARDRDGFLMLREVVELIRELRPEEGLGEGIDQLAALVHHCYLYWDAGCNTILCPAEQLSTLLADQPARGASEEISPYYVRLPEHRIWARAVPGEPHEPLDGCFVHALESGESLRVLGVFGLHQDRAGFSVVEVTGHRPASLRRVDGSGLFSPTLPGGVPAGLFSLAGGEELLELGWRTRRLLGEPAVEAG
jgi:hypothetical protein